MTTPPTRPALPREGRPISPGRVILAVVAVIVMTIGSCVAGIGVLVLQLCGLDDDTCAQHSGWWSLALLVLAVGSFLGTSPVAGKLLDRWWAWMTPVWIIVAVFGIGPIMRLIDLLVPGLGSP